MDMVSLKERVVLSARIILRCGPNGVGDFKSRSIISTRIMTIRFSIVSYIPSVRFFPKNYKCITRNPTVVVNWSSFPTANGSVV